MEPAFDLYRTCGRRVSYIEMARETADCKVLAADSKVSEEAEVLHTEHFS